MKLIQIYARVNDVRELLVGNLIGGVGWRLILTPGFVKGNQAFGKKALVSLRSGRSKPR
ncbi:MAG TPA: hypothetical protein VHZ55_09160 [Bryobacteraceae bacterium]|nr:hypothetical protein [Bryobacteraceae bacterium]